MTGIPDDVVERAARIIDPEGCAAYEKAYAEKDGFAQIQTINRLHKAREKARAAGRVFVEWEREECAKVAEAKRIAPTNTAPALVADLRSDRIARAIRARGE